MITNKTVCRICNPSYILLFHENLLTLFVDTLSAAFIISTHTITESSIVTR